CAENEPAGNENPNSVDLVGAAGLSAAYFQIDSNFLYLRERVAGSPSGSGGFDQYAWVVLVQTASGNPFQYQWLISLDGKLELVELWNNTPASNIDFNPVFNDPADTLSYSASTSTLARFVSAGSTIGGSANYFVDWAMPISELSARGIDPS